MRMSGLASGMDTEGIINEMMKIQRMKTTKIENNITKLEWQQDKWKTLNTKIYALYTGPLSKIRLEGSFNAKNATSSNSNKLEVTANGSVPEGTHTIEVKSTASAQFVTGSELNLDSKAGYSTKLSDLYKADGEFPVGSKINIAVGDNEEVVFKVESETTIGDFVSSLQKAGLNASFDTVNQRFFISSKESGADQAFTIRSEDSEGNPNSTDLLSKMGLSEIRKDVNDAGEVTINGGENVSIINPSDAVVVYNGAEIRSSSNTITANGLTMTVKGITESDEKINIAITKDTEAVYDMVKDFISSYNEVLSELNDSYHATSAKGYEPLTDEERQVMSEDQIEKWEDRIKDSLLRRDGTVRSISDAMRNTLSRRVSVGDKLYSLADFGITSVDYTERGLLHIDGDEDDVLVAGKVDKLMQAILEDPDAVKEVFTSLTKELHSTMTEQMGSTPLSSALTFYNDKEMTKTLARHNEDLANMEKRLLKIEDRYYRQFSAMESMMSQLNSQSDSVMALFGMSTNG